MPFVVLRSKLRLLIKDSIYSARPETVRERQRPTTIDSRASASTYLVSLLLYSHTPLFLLEFPGARPLTAGGRLVHPVFGEVPERPNHPSRKTRSPVVAWDDRVSTAPPAPRRTLRTLVTEWFLNIWLRFPFSVWSFLLFSIAHPPVCAPCSVTSGGRA